MPIASLALVALCGCGDGPTDPPPGSDAGPDAAGCDEVMAASETFALRRCAGQDRLGIAVVGSDGVRAAIDGIGPAVDMGGERIDARGWSTVVWRPDPDGLALEWRDHPIAPDVALELRFDGACVRADTRVSSATGVGVEVEALHVLEQSGDTARLDAGLWTLAPDVRDGRSGSDPDPAPRLLAEPGRALIIGALDPAHPLWVGLSGDAALTPTLTATRRGPLRIDGELTVRWALCAAGDAITALQALGDHLGAGSGAAPPRVATRATLDADLTATADRIALAGRFGHVWFADDWAADRSTWSPAPAVTALVEAIAPATVGVRWPLLAIAPDAPLALEHPEWLDAACTAGCPRLDPRIPAVREHLARVRLALGDAGLEIRLVGTDSLDPTDLTALLAALDLDARGPPALATPDPRTAPPVEGPRASSLPVRAPAGAAVTLARWQPLAGGSRVEGPVELPPPGADPAALRRAQALALIGGYAELGADADPSAMAPLVAYWQARPTPDAARPIPGLWFATDPPSTAPWAWRASDRLILVNPSPTEPLPVARPVDLAPDLRGATSLLHAAIPPLDAVDAIEIPPGDAVVWATVDGDPPAE